MKKAISLILILVVFAAIFAGCANKNTGEITLILDKGADNYDFGCNQGAWNGIVMYSKAKNVSRNFAFAEENTNEARLAAIDTAVEDGAKMIVLTDAVFTDTLKNAKDKYKEVVFIGIGIEGGESGNGDNVTIITLTDTQKADIAKKESAVTTAVTAAETTKATISAEAKTVVSYIEAAVYKAIESCYTNGMTLTAFYKGKNNTLAEETISDKTAETTVAS